jgi:hypothetical protein
VTYNRSARCHQHRPDTPPARTEKRGKAKSLGILAANLARAVYQVLTKKVAFDEQRFWNS